MSRKKRIRGILIFSLVTAVSVCLLYYLTGAPSFSPEMAMHRKEARQLVGPSRVIAGDAVEYGTYDDFLLGETEHGYCLYEYNDRPTVWDGGLLFYFEKSDPVTIFPSGTAYMWNGGIPRLDDIVLPVFVIPESPRAASASLTLTAEYDGTHYEVSQTASLRQGEFFLFELDVAEAHSYVRDFWDRKLKGNPAVYGYVSGTATLELFDRQGERIETVVMEFPEMT